MSRTSIFEKRWLDLVFEGKNKAYGAYQLRLENPRTTMLALLYALLLIGGTSGAGVLLSSFGTKPDENTELPPIIDDSLHVTEVIIRKPTENIIAPKIEKPKTEVTKPVEDWRDNPEVASANEATSDPDNTKIETPPAVDNPGSGNATGNETGNSTGSGTVEGPKDDGNALVIAAAVDKQPAFPGGIGKFYERVANTFEKPEMYEDATIKIIVSFVVEKDGQMSNIKVMNQPGESLSSEAVRVLKDISKRKKWEPGMKNGHEVRTIFTLPIVIKPQ